MKYDPKGHENILDHQAELLVAMFEGCTVYEFERTPKEVWEKMLKTPVSEMFGTMYIEEAREYIRKNFARVPNRHDSSFMEILHK